MHTEMWEHAATRANVATLRERGVLVVEPASGRLTGVEPGAGRLPEPPQLFALCRRVLARGLPHPDLAGRRVVVSAGGTREPLDPVRFLGNRSSGKQGYALALTAVARGAQGVLVTTADLADPAGAQVVRVETAEQLRVAMHEHAEGADAVVMAAAVADYRPAQVAAHKMKKSDDGSAPDLALVRNPDVLVELVEKRSSGQVVVGFAAETGDEDGDVLAHGRAKLARKGCDLLVVNDVGAGKAFGTDTNSAVLLGRDGTEATVPAGPKEALADAVWDVVDTLWHGSPG
jgi:phosphopantothenoylcysteine decarboxylase/phosphopantothenate--cysteine ligase